MDREELIARLRRNVVRQGAIMRLLPPDAVEREAARNARIAMGAAIAALESLPSDIPSGFVKDEQGFSDADCLAVLLDGYARDKDREKLPGTAKSFRRAAELLRAASFLQSRPAPTEGRAREVVARRVAERFARRDWLSMPTDTDRRALMKSHGLIPPVTDDELTVEGAYDAADDILAALATETQPVAGGEQYRCHSCKRIVAPQEWDEQCPHCHSRAFSKIDAPPKPTTPERAKAMEEALAHSQRLIRATHIGRGTVGGSCGICSSKWIGDHELHADGCLVAMNDLVLSASPPEVDAAAMTEREQIARRIAEWLDAPFDFNAPVVPRSAQDDIRAIIALRATPEGQLPWDVLLACRDKFIVERGLWSDFVDWIAASPKDEVVGQD